MSGDPLPYIEQGGMKAVDMTTVDLVHSGEAWPHSHPPCSRQMLRHLERNEGVVTWVQPKGGAVEDQYPVIRIGAQYFTMSLRMMKAVWRSVRLRKGFVNVEKAPFGGLKLKIPTLLYVEKMRTQSRFNLMRMEATTTTTPSIGTGSLTHPPEPPSTSEERQVGGKERKVVHNASSKVSLVVQRMLLPLLDAPLRSHVVFDVEKDQTELDLMDQLSREKPEVLEDSKSFVEHLQMLYDRYKQGGVLGVPQQGAYQRVSVVCSDNSSRV